MKKLFLFFSLFLLLIFSLSACSSKNQLNENSWQDEIIFASECGFSGLKCCPESETSCLYGLNCCSNPGDPEMNYCSNECSYGTLNNFCRDSDPRCDPEMTCYNNFCQKAGGEKQPCLPGGTCSDDLICNDGICSECGLTGNLCCNNDQDYQCKNENVYDRERSACIDNICKECGFSPYDTCTEPPFCNPGYLINNNNCLKCGLYNQPCCKDINKASFCENEDLFCTNGFCL